MKVLRPFIILLFLACVSLESSLAGSDSNIISDSNITKSAGKPILLDPLSGRPLYLIQIRNDEILGTATGFIVQKNNKHFLITNWHVVSGRKTESGQPREASGKTPNALLIWHHGKQLGTWVRKKEELYDKKGMKLWLEHKRGQAVDVVALPLRRVDDDVTIYLFDLSLAETDMLPEVAMPVSIIGFPIGLTSAGFFPIWKTGHIASEPNLDFHGQPLFIIDATTRGGMSGSPVVLRMTGGYKKKDGSTIMSSSGYSTLFLGVYSGRLGDSEIGVVWRPHLIHEILKQVDIPTN